jgi:hypothetical protein
MAAEELEKIIKEMSIFTGHFPKDAINGATAHYSELRPQLLASLDYVYENRASLLKENSDYYLYSFAMFLAAQVKDTSAFPALVRYLSMTEDEIEFFLNDTLTEDFCYILRETFNGDVDSLKKIIENDGYYLFARMVAMDTLILVFHDGFIHREELLAFIRSLIARTPKDDCSDLAEITAKAVMEAHFTELIPDIKVLYDSDVIDTFSVCTYEKFVKHTFDLNYRSFAYSRVDMGDIIGNMGSWACFQEESPHRSSKTYEDNDDTEEYEEKNDAPYRPAKKIGRNEPCPCGSGKKYKKCCLGKEYLHPGLFLRANSAPGAVN